MRHLLLAPLALLAMVACEADVSALNADAPAATNYQTDKTLAKPDEVAATLRARATLDALVDPGLFQVTSEARLNRVIEGCTSDSVANLEPVYREVDCEGLSGWGFEVLYDDCILDDGDRISGTLFFSFAGLNDALPEAAASDEVASVVTAVLDGMGPERTARYEGSFIGDNGGALEVCGEYSGRVEQRWQREVVDVWLGNLNGRLLWDGTSSRMDAETPEAREVLDGRLLAQFPAGAVADPYVFQVTALSRQVHQTLPAHGQVTQRGWDSELRVAIDRNAVDNHTVRVEDGVGGVTVDLPRW